MPTREPSAPRELFEVAIMDSERTRRIRVGGELDLSNRHLLTRDGLAGLDRRLSAVVLDAAGLTYVDAAGLGALVALCTQLLERGIRLRTVNAGDRLCRIVGICGLDDVLGIESTPPHRRSPAR